VSFWVVREATRASFSFWVGPGGRAGCRAGLAGGGGVTTAGGDTICSVGWTQGNLIFKKTEKREKRREKDIFYH